MVLGEIIVSETDTIADKGKGEGVNIQCINFSDFIYESPLAAAE